MGDNQQGVKPYYLTTIGAITADSHDLQYYNLVKVCLQYFNVASTA
jgi:hypothetical protein